MSKKLYLPVPWNFHAKKELGSVTVCKASGSVAKASALSLHVVANAQKDLEDTEQEVVDDQLKKANDADWQTYKAEANKTIAANDTRILELKKVAKKSGTRFDTAYEKSIDELEKRNKSLKTKIEDYENNKTDWTSFKREFNSDMTELGKALKDLTVDNKK